LNRKKIFICAVYLAACIFQPQSGSILVAQSPGATADALKKNAADNQMVTDAGKSNVGIKLTVDSNVADSADIQAVLIPAGLAKKIFGKEVANNYAVVEVIISNQDTKASMIVQSLFLDYSDWLLAGHMPGNPTQAPNQKANQPSQVASIESRIVRGELLDGQQWTARNWTMRVATFLGSAGVAFSFPFSTDVIKGISAFNGVVVPGAATLWPDGSIPQINRISDFGFQTNKVIAKQSAEVIVAFFPIERFLTPTFRDEFIKHPAAWFVPYELMMDPKTQGDFVKVVQPLYDATAGKETDEKAFLKAAMAAMNADCSESTSRTGKQDMSSPCGMKTLLDKVSLNNIRVVVQGAMTVNVATIPATIYDLNCGDTDPWSTTEKDVTCSLSGVYLTGGVPSIVDASGKPIPGVTISPVADGSTDTNLNFTMKLTKCVTSSTRVFVVVKKTPGGDSTGNSKGAAAGGSSKTDSRNAVPSSPFEFSPQPSRATCPSEPAPGPAAPSAAPGPKPEPAPPAPKK
jgi:hypothetical protein